MTTWILTVGDSDVFLSTATHWDDLKRRAKDRRLASPLFLKTEVSTPTGERLFSYPARALGAVYADQIENHVATLRFPRLEALLQGLAQCQWQPQRIVVLLTDQSNLFGERDRQPKDPYWRDTCELEPLLRHYLGQALPDATQQYLLVSPEANCPGLDHWDSTLSLIQALLGQVDWTPRKPVYVSHQAGTPALSSAVQFVTLTRFGSQVQFLVSNEFQTSSELIPSSTYLWGIRLQEARRLLHRYDYAGVQDVLRQDIPIIEPAIGRRIEDLLNSAILWNQAKFAEFAASLQEAPDRTEEWWWAGYESAFLALVRLEQGNTVEALFHSFRAAEGMLSDWAKWYYQEDIKANKKGAPVAFLREGSGLPAYLQEELADKTDGLMLYSGSLFKLFETAHPEFSDNENINIIWKGASSIRNQQFHRLLGLDEREVFRAWGTKENRAAWQKRLLNCLNSITNQNFESIQTASLMATIHQDLKTIL
ncbi:hypothetical protein VB780_03475 [Leptolyngbya sp. CCNP1308]|uniref:hypothetical protein n=1 Tax=Leptolyngbya sp. CCNP1308 TaxID=3110255 RepID=UPI002B1EA579|nr:hypothetical protein [Leptolyngbya sp. CCNP1308]MEA5447615.1 hypothetical protein [Leptolyngbya sp. CCNP1308]